MNYKLSLKFETGGYIEVDDFVGKAPVYVTLRYLKELYRQYGTQFEIFATEIAERRKIHRSTVQSAFETLEKMQIIKMLGVSKRDGTTIRFNADQYVSLASCYTELSDENKIKFAQCLQNQDWAGLKKLKFVCKKGAGKNLSTLPMKGCSFETTDVGLETTDVGLETTDVGLETTDVGLETTDVGLETTDVGLETTVVLKPAAIISISTSIWRDLIEEYGSDVLILASEELFGATFDKKMIEGLKNGNPDLISRFPVVDFETSGCRFRDIWLSSFRHLMSISRQLHIIIEKEKKEKEMKKIEDFPIKGEKERFFDKNEEGLEEDTEEELTKEGFPVMKFELNTPENDQQTSSYIKSLSPYKNKPYFKRSEVKDFLRGFKNNIIAYPVDFFINRFWWYLWDWYKNETGLNNPEVDDNGIERMETPSDSDSFIMDSQYMPLNLVLDTARNVYDDLTSYFQQGQYIDEHDNVIKFHDEITQEEIDDFDYRYVFDWDIMTDREGVRQIKIAIDKFRDINADDVIEAKPARKEDKALIHSQNLKYWELLRSDMETDSPLEKAQQQFIKTFCIVSKYGPIDAFIDERGYEFECPTKFPDYKLKDWCIRTRLASHKDFTSVLVRPYRAIDGIGVGSYLFDARKTARWNELNGYAGNISHQAL